MEEILREQIEALKELLDQKDQKIKYLESLLVTHKDTTSSNTSNKSITPYFSGDF